MTDIKVERTPFKEAIEFFKDKEKVPSRTWTDLLHSEHGKSFVIAGVMDVGILSDVHELLAKSMQEGIPLKQFQKEFKKTIEGRWLPTSKTGEPNSGWRARVIYETNIKTAYAAARYEKFQKIKKTHPYWRYRHGSSRVPREDHLKWDGLVLLADDPWWDTHYPPNGFGCSCYAEAISELELKMAGKDGPDEAPPMDMRTVKFGDREIEVPKGVDPGWAYAPGASEYQAQLQALAQGEPRIVIHACDRIQNEAPQFFEQATKEYEKWVDGLLTTRRTSSEAQTIGLMTSDVFEGAKGCGLKPASAGIEAIDKDILHLRKPSKVKDWKAISIEDLKNIPTIIANPQAVLYSYRENNLLYVFDPKDGDERKGKIVVGVAVDEFVKRDGIKVKRTLNKIVSAGLVPLFNLKDEKFYKILKGSL